MTAGCRALSRSFGIRRPLFEPTREGAIVDSLKATPITLRPQSRCRIENFPADQAALLREARVPHRQIGRDISCFGIQDLEIIPLLHRLKRVTLFTQDQDFFKQRLCHSAYCVD